MTRVIGADNRSTRSLAGVYQTLGHAYLESPTKEWLENAQDWAANWQDQLTPEQEQLDASLQKISGTELSKLEQLQIAYTRLFRGISDAHSPKPPYESVYREGTVHGAVTNDVRELYRSVGLELDTTQEPADHLGIELQFVGTLCEWEAEGAPADVLEPDRIPQMRAEFVSEHLLQWFPDFKSACLENDPPALYAGWIELTDMALRDQLKLD